MVKLALALFLASAAVSAATLQGVVNDWDTGRPLARTVLNLEAIQGGQTVSRNSIRADRYGVFAFPALSPGIYLLTAARPSYATQQYGQKGWNRPGVPLLIEGDKPIGIQIRLRRLTSITGTVWDENQVGVPGVPVVVYTSTRPVRIVARTNTDDRGIYRAGELVPGSYIVRNAAKLMDDGISLLPTFFPEGFALSNARVVEVDLDRPAAEVNFQPAQGRLFHIGGRVTGPTQAPGSIELIADTGRVSTSYDGSGSFSFDAVAPGVYELLVQTPKYAAWRSIRIDQDMNDLRLSLSGLAPSQFQVERDGTKADARTVSLFARRKDLDADGPVVPFISGRTELVPGNWEIAVSTQPDSFAVALISLSSPSNSNPSRRADGWNRINQANGWVYLRVQLSSHPASIGGRVISSLNDAAGAVPVFLETLDLDPAEAPQIRSTRTDQMGQYRFTGLPPGRYRLFSSYDVDPSNRNSIEAARPRVVSIRESANDTQDLELIHQ